MTTTTFQLKTPDGPCTTELVAHAGTGPRPAVVLFFDAGGLRPAQTRIAERIAKMATWCSSRISSTARRLKPDLLTAL